MTVLEAQPAQPEVALEQGHVEDTNVLRKDRFRFGLGNILYQSEETGLNPITTLIVRALGGGAQHLGVYQAAASMGSVVQWVGTLLLRKFNSNRKAMICSMIAGLVIAALLASCILASYISMLAGLALWGYLILAWAFVGTGGVQMNIETAWIGDLVPTKRLAWFTGTKWFLGVLGIFFFSFGFARMCKAWPHRYTYATIYAMFAVSFAVAIFLYRGVTDRVPKNARFVGFDRQSRLNYGSVALWCYIAFSCLWTIGRQAQLAFTSAYLLDNGYDILQIAWIWSAQYVTSMAAVLLMGKVADKSGHRFWLASLSGLVACCMFLWVSSAWWGIAPIIAYYFFNGLAGHTSSMLGTNYGLEIFPAKGRSGYFAFAKLITGAIGATSTIIAGTFMQGIQGLEFQLWGARLNHYHVFFAVTAVVTLSSIIPLVLVGKRTVPEAGSSLT